MSRRSSLLTLAVVLIGGAGLRLHHLGTESLWLDEAFSITVGRTTLSNIVLETSRDVHPPLYYFLLHYWMRLAGDSEAGGRLLSVVFSLGIIGAAYALTARLFDRRTGLVAAALLAVSPFQVEFAQEARMYTMLALAATVSTYALVQLTARWRLVWFLAYIATTSILTYTHIHGAFVIAAQGVTVGWLVLADRARARSLLMAWLSALAIVLALFIPWMSILAAQTARVQSGFWIPLRPWLALFESVWTYAGSTATTILLSVAAVWGAIQTSGRASLRGTAPTPLAVLVPWLLCPIVLPFILSRIGSPIFLPKYTIAASVPFAILAARGATAVRLGRGSIALIVVAVTAYLSLGTLRTYYEWPRKDGWREAAAKVEAGALPNDLVFLYRGFNQIPFDYYLRRRDLAERPFAIDTTNATADTLAPLVSRDIGDHPRVWFITLSYEPAQTVIAQAFRVSRPLGVHREAHNVDIYLFEGQR